MNPIINAALAASATRAYTAQTQSDAARENLRTKLTSMHLDTAVILTESGALLCCNSDLPLDFYIGPIALITAKA